MATSGTYTFTVTRDDIIREAMLNIGKLGASDILAPQDTLDCARKLNLMVKQWMGKTDFAKGLKVWTRQHCDLFLSSTKFAYNLGPSGDAWAAGITVAQPNGANFAQAKTTAPTAGGSAILTIGTAAVANVTAGDFIVVAPLTSGDSFSSTVLSTNSGAGTVTMNASLPASVSLPTGSYVNNFTTKGQRPMELQTAILRDTNFVDSPLNYMTLQTYEALPTKTQSGNLSDPAAVYYEAQLGNGVLYIDVAGAQDTTKWLHVVGLRPIQDFNNPLDNPDYPAEWFDALCWGLAMRIAPMYNAVWTPDMQLLHDSALAIARESYPETTEIYFQCNADVA
jgi:hypothetical protein